MANRSSTQIANRDAVPVILNSPSQGSRALVKGSYGYVPILTTDSVNDVFRICQIPSNAIIRSMRYFTSALGGACTVDVGIHRTTKDGGAVVDRDYFATAISLVTAVSAGTEIAAESGAYSIIRREQPLWQALGGGLFTQDPQCLFDLTMSLNVVAAADGQTGIDVLYVD